MRKKKVELRFVEIIRDEYLLPAVNAAPGYVGKVKDKPTSYLEIILPTQGQVGREEEKGKG